MWLASTLPARASACRPASNGSPAPQHNRSLPAQGLSGQGERLDSAAAVLAAVVARRRRLQQAKAGPCAPVEERQSVAAEEDEHRGLVAAQQPWRGRRKRNKKGLAAQEHGGSAPELACSNRSLDTRDAVCSGKGEASERDESGAEVAASQQGAGDARDAAWYATRRRKSDRKLAQVRFVRVDAKARVAMHGARASVYAAASWPLSSLFAPNSSIGVCSSMLGEGGQRPLPDSISACGIPHRGGLSGLHMAGPTSHLGARAVHSACRRGTERAVHGVWRRLTLGDRGPLAGCAPRRAARACRRPHCKFRNAVNPRLGRQGCQVCSSACCGASSARTDRRLLCCSWTAHVRENCHFGAECAGARGDAEAHWRHLRVCGRGPGDSARTETLRLAASVRHRQAWQHPAHVGSRRRASAGREVAAGGGGGGCANEQ